MDERHKANPTVLDIYWSRSVPGSKTWKSGLRRRVTDLADKYAKNDDREALREAAEIALALSVI